MLIKLLDYDSQLKTAVVEFYGIDSDEIIQFLVRLQQISGMKTDIDIRVKSTPNNTLKSPDLSSLDDSASQTSDTQTEDSESIFDSEKDMEKAIQKSLEILREEED